MGKKGSGRPAKGGPGRIPKRLLGRAPEDQLAQSGRNPVSLPKNDCALAPQQRLGIIRQLPLSSILRLADRATCERDDELAAMA